MTPPSDHPPSGQPPDGEHPSEHGNESGAEEYPADYNPPEHPVPPGYPPQGYPPPGYPPQGPYNQPYGAPPPKQPGRVAVGTAIVGTFLYFVINFVIGFGAFIVGAEQESKIVFGGTALLLALLAFGGGALLLTRNSRDAKGMGLGLMIGWAITSVVSAGFCTGLNPDLYT